MHSFELTYNLDIDEYSALILVGGDGTFHEAINGMLFRPDKKKLPLAFIPNGTGNDFCSGLKLKTLD